MKRIRIIKSLAEEGQDGIENYIGTEWDTVEEYQPNIKRNSKNWNGLEKGEIRVILKSKEDPNLRNQASILNEGEYIYI